MQQRVVLLVVLLSLIIAAASANQLLMAYYSGLGDSTVGQAGLNALAICFFSPSALGGSNCNFNDVNTPCVAPATGGGANTLKFVYATIDATRSQLAANTAPSRNQKPTFLISFGGANEGGRPWDTLFSSSASAANLGRNAAALANAVRNKYNGEVVVGIDLDIEGTSTTLPYFGQFVNAYRANARYADFPLQICTLSGFASSGSSDHFKLLLLKSFGPAQQGVSHVNMMVNNVDSSCDVMSKFWLDPALSFIPPNNRVFGIWGELYPSFILHDPGCNTLFPYMSTNGVNIGIWEWWTGPTNQISALISKVRQN